MGALVVGSRPMRAAELEGEREGGMYRRKVLYEEARRMTGADKRSEGGEATEAAGPCRVRLSAATDDRRTGGQPRHATPRHATQSTAHTPSQGAHPHSQATQPWLSSALGACHTISSQSSSRSQAATEMTSDSPSRQMQDIHNCD